LIFLNNHDYELIENNLVKNSRQINRVIESGDRMVIDEMKKEMVEFKFDQNQIDNATEIIYFIGVGQDLAWREGEGVIRSDISINKSLLNFLKQGYILEAESKYAKYPIYKLNVQGEEIFQELIEANKPNFKRFRTEFLEINPKTFAILMLPDNPNNKDIDRLEVQYNYRILFDNSKKGDQLKHIYYNQLHNFHVMLEKYDLLIKLTSFQSNRMYSKGKFIKGNNFYQLLIEYIESFPTQLYDSLTELNKKVSFFDDLTISIRKIEIRDEISDKYHEFYDEYKFLLENLKDNKIITTFDPSKSPCFKIIDEQKYKNEIGKLKKECIDKVTEPIIDELIAGNLDTSSQPITPQQQILFGFEYKIEKNSVEKNKKIFQQESIGIGQRPIAERIIRDWLENVEGNISCWLNYIDETTISYLNNLPRTCEIRIITSEIQNINRFRTEASKFGRFYPKLEVKMIRINSETSSDKTKEFSQADKAIIHKRKILTNNNIIDFGTDLKSSALGNTKHDMLLMEADNSDKEKFDIEWNRNEFEWKRIEGIPIKLTYYKWS